MKPASKTPTIADGRRRLMDAQARRAELKAGREAGELIEVAVAQREWAAHVVRARNKLLGVPSRAKQRLPHLSVADVGVLDALVREALEELADGAADAEGPA